ncbi:MAG TPA: 16S rRNA (cytosine(967)-C(5))-methyltransferase RsmB [Geobacteraceae bacterium]|nr:16S rRNA (cytosine(967)-C(5))-methyltransferase RsmB [Geobacteraceae bacterium]
MSTANPRRAAFDILLRIEKERSYADILIDRELSLGKLEGPDRGLLTELVYGVLRRRGTLDHVINLFSRQRTDKLERSVLILLRLGLYQELFLDRVPVSAAVNETVNLAKSLAPRAAGYINAVLRRADRERDSIHYPDRQKDTKAYLAARYSHPLWLVGSWLRQLPMDEAEALAEAMSGAPPLTTRVNTLKIGRDELIEKLAGEGVVTTPTRFSPHGLNIASRTPLVGLPSFQEGLFTIQDESSQVAAILLAPLPGERVLDVCAAPGGKTTHIAQLMENRGSITAADTSRRKIALIEENAQRLGISIITTAILDAVKPVPAQEKYDRILVDAPCSGLGVLRRNPEGKWWKTPADIAELVARQKAILGNAADLLKDGGTLLYATCSTALEENEAVVADFLSKKSDFVLEDLRLLFPALTDLFTEDGFFRSWPHRQGMDGFFAARLRKTT